ncbi:4-diphosphocytidyl-2-C-methyl-D-erythritol kinase [Anaerobacterium chartisolvens]|uniref:4-diphosphocytidyl-2-C-methyl-D-erythritol kinase n=1 Tax=Anaerobacterium chartisolvens TaxID=1297424 RepID=A0A369B3B3_9FIRM|nr:4-(cytidine 5'-diphospho)-2-C-methyl-D-erythritol kinase [Anaerobacterium chartisolvens]RCX16080.1 4-diphosphocytidyl-2-C-methyl-D-erythritol kinase [Anaerobacterium chartisolvens]
MNSIELEARAKINLSLDVTGRRDDGYHTVKMIMQTVALHDRVMLETAREGIEIQCNCRWVPSNESNIAYKAAKLLMETAGVKTGVKIVIDKRIPVAAGLAGGSSDAAAVLKGLNTLLELGLSTNELIRVAKQIGADVPYCILGGTMLAEGIGEILTALSPLKGVAVVLVKPKIGVSTAWVYSNLDLKNISRHPDTDLLISAIKNRDLSTLCKNTQNVLETVTIPKYGVIQRIKDTLMELGAIGSMMSGSGPTVFGVFKNAGTAERAYRHVRKFNWECILTSTY